MSRDRDEFIAVVVEAYCWLPKANRTKNVIQVTDLARGLLRLGREMKALCERYCNEPMPEGAFEKKRKSIDQRANAITQELGPCCKPIFQQDPRGFTLRLKLNTAMSNTMDHVWGVPTS